MTRTQETPLAEAMAKLAERGYTAEFVADADGLHAVGTPCKHPPEALVVDALRRFEGVTNPDDEAILFALRCAEHGVRGTYASAYGPAAAPPDAEMVRRLGRPAGDSPIAPG